MSYPALKSLGINRPHEISGYTLSSTNDVDTLRIRYTRQRGSLLPTVRKYQFPRRPMPGVASTDGQLLTEVSPALEDALNELSSLLSKKKDSSNRKAELLRDLEAFENYIREELADFRSDIEKL